jgi:hypothetical protein
MVSLQSVNVAVRLNPLYGTSGRHTQACVLWIAVRGSWLSVQGAERGPKIARGIRRAPFVADCAPAPCDVHQLPAAPLIIRGQAQASPTDTDPFLALFQSIRQVSSMACSFPIDTLYVDQYDPYRDPIGGMN